MSAYLHLMRRPVINAWVNGSHAAVRFDDRNGVQVVVSDTPEALVATLTEALEAVDRAWRASRGEVGP